MQLRKNEIDPYWRTAGDRVFLYLRCLNFPAAQAFELSLRALKEAEQNILNDDLKNNPVAESVEALHELLRKEQYEIIGGEKILNYWCERKWMQEIEGEDISFFGDHGRSPARVSSMPPIRRLHMTPQELSPTNVRELFGKLIRR